MTLTVEVPGRSRDHYNSLVRTISAATNLQDKEQPLVIDGICAFCKPRKRSAPITYSNIGLYCQFKIQFVATDWRLYDANLTETPLRLPGLSGVGLSVPARVPFQVTVSPAGDATITNASDGVLSHPVIVIQGPAVAPRIMNATTGQMIRVPLTLGNNDVVTIDTYWRTIYLNNAERTEGLDTDWWGLVPGDNLILFRANSYNTRTLCTVQWRSAWA